jgi:hypothetical protein
MTLRSAPLTLYGSPADRPPVSWEWVDAQLGEAGVYWLVPTDPARPPMPRPLWGVWAYGRLRFSVGSPRAARALAAHAVATVHLPSGTDVVIVEARVVSDGMDAATFADLYNRKYGTTYGADFVGPPTVLEPTTVLAYRAAGRDGRDGFTHAAKWVAVS